MARRRSKSKQPKSVETFTHEEATRPNIPSAEHQAVVSDEIAAEIKVAYERRNRDLNPQLVWRGKDDQGLSDLVVNAPPIYMQEKVHPKVLVDDLMRRTEKDQLKEEEQIDLFADAFEEAAEGSSAEFYQHEQNWTNRMILGDSLQVMASLAEREGLRGKVQCIYIDPRYGIKFNSNFQWSTSRDVKDGKTDHITREAEMVKAFRDTWRYGTHSYLTYLRDRLIVARDLLTDSGSIFVQIGDENVHRVRAILDEVFGENNFVSLIPFRTKTRSLGGQKIEGMLDYICCYAKSVEKQKFRTLFEQKDVQGDSNWKWVELDGFERRRMTKKEQDNHSILPAGSRVFRTVDLRPAGRNESARFNFVLGGKSYPPPGGNSWLTSEAGMHVLRKADRLVPVGSTIERIYYLADYPVTPITNLWSNTRGAVDKRYVVQTNDEIVKRCILMATDPGDIVLDPTCGSGTTAAVAEQWGRRWITIDTSRVALTGTGPCPYQREHAILTIYWPIPAKVR